MRDVCWYRLCLLLFPRQQIVQQQGPVPLGQAGMTSTAEAAQLAPGIAQHACSSARKWWTLGKPSPRSQTLLDRAVVLLPGLRSSVLQGHHVTSALPEPRTLYQEHVSKQWMDTTRQGGKQPVWKADGRELTGRSLCLNCGAQHCAEVPERVSCSTYAPALS